MISQALLAEFESEAKTTRRFLERLTADQLNWKPHPKSMTAGQLGLHIAQIPGAIIQFAMQDTVQAPDFSKPFPQASSLTEILDAHDASVIKVREILPTYTDDLMQKTWSAMANGQPAMSMPRVMVIRMILLNHWIQHRGQFGVYLRLLGAKVPHSYGPSGDESPF